MTALGYLGGLGSLIVVIAGAASVGRAGRRVLAPDWSGPMAVLVTVIAADVFAVLDGEVLGTVGLFSRVPLVVSCAVFGLAAVPVGQRRGGPARRQTTGRRPDLAAGLAMVCGGLVLAQGLVAVRTTTQTGNLFIDALEYHLTVAAHFATSHHTTGIIQLAPSSPVSYYPFNDELLHGIGIAVFGRDTLSLFLGVFDLAAMLLAAWCVGSEAGYGALTLCAICPALATLGQNTGDALNDWASIWPILAAVAVLVRCRGAGVRWRGPITVAGLATGLAIGTKVSAAPAGVALVVGCVWCVPQGRKIAALVRAALAATLAGGYWYIRDVVRVGSPLPSQHLPGLPRVPMPGFTSHAYSVAHYLSDGAVVRGFFGRGLRIFFGPAWPVLLGLALIGVVLALARGTRADRVVAAVVVFAVVAYLLTPSGAFGAAGAPYLFKVNLRYALPAVCLALLLLGRSEVARRWPRTFASVMLVLLAIALDRDSAWPVGRRTIAAFAAASVAVVLCSALIVALPPHRRRRLGVVLGIVAAVAVGYPLNRAYLKDRYRPVGTAQRELYGALNGESGAKIGVVGLPGLYPYLGPTYANQVAYVGRTLTDHTFADYSTCPSWRAAVAGGRFTFVAAEISPGSPPPPALAWTESDPAARLVIGNSAGAIFAIGPGFGKVSCS